MSGARAKWHWAIDRLRATVRVEAAEHFALHADSRSTTSRRFPRVHLNERKKKSVDDGSSSNGGGGGGGGRKSESHRNQEGVKPRQGQ